MAAIAGQRYLYGATMIQLLKPQAIFIAVFVLGAAVSSNGRYRSDGKEKF
jgi:hypothetical protein